MNFFWNIKCFWATKPPIQVFGWPKLDQKHQIYVFLDSQNIAWSTNLSISKSELFLSEGVRAYHPMLKVVGWSISYFYGLWGLRVVLVFGPKKSWTKCWLCQNHWFWNGSTFCLVAEHLMTNTFRKLTQRPEWVSFNSKSTISC